MIRPIVIATSIFFFAGAVGAEDVQIQLSADAEADQSSAGEQASSRYALPEDPPAALPSTSALTIPEGFNAKLEYGHGLYLKGDYQGALTVYRAAKDTKATDPLPLYFIACAQAKLTQYDDAMTTLAALQTVCGEKLSSLHARALFLVAFIEETRGNLENAKSAWSTYKQFAASHAGIQSFAGSADARIVAIEKKSELNTQYKVVRERITGSTE